jgi:hypothetical protein
LYLAVVLATVALVAACSDGESGAGDSGVRPFAEVQASALGFENDATFPDRGIFRVTTTEPMICAIVWGETEALGRFNNSLDMNGTGIVEHNVFLPGARAGATYYYRVQGSTADGRLYQSELATFTLPAVGASGGVSPSQPVGANLALDATVEELSSEFSASWSGANALDGDLTTEWSSAGDGNDAFITVDLGAERDVAAVEFVTRSMPDGSAITMSYSVVVDGEERLGPFVAGTPAEPALQRVAISGRRLRFEVEESTGGNTGALEIRAFGPAD